MFFHLKSLAVTSFALNKQTVFIWSLHYFARNRFLCFMIQLVFLQFRVIFLPTISRILKIRLFSKLNKKLLLHQKLAFS